MSEKITINGKLVIEGIPFTVHLFPNRIVVEDDGTGNQYDLDLPDSTVILTDERKLYAARMREWVECVEAVSPSLYAPYADQFRQRLREETSKGYYARTEKLCPNCWTHTVMFENKDACIGCGWREV